MQAIMQILIGTSIFSIIHAATPHHWIPIIAISKAENWSRRETLPVTIIVGISSFDFNNNGINLYIFGY